MEPSGVFRHRRTLSSDRFLNVFSGVHSEVSLAVSGSSTGDELNEDDVFWTGDFAEPNRRPKSSFLALGNEGQPRRRASFRQQENFGILAVLPGADPNGNIRDGPVLYRTNSISSSSPRSASSSSSSSSRMIPLIPKPPQSSYDREYSDYSQSISSRKFHQSAPMMVPVLSKAMDANRERSSVLLEVDGDDEDDEMLPPHEIVARGSSRSPKTTFSVLEGVGRTLKGRDLRQVRNAVWRRTGFLD